MRLTSLYLDRYGHFTDRQLEFPPGKAVCLVYGPNEAGKSTALTALCDLLFGFPHNAAYDFLHDRRLLRVGGTLRRSGGEEITVRRRRGRENTLLGAEERPIPDGALAPFLGGIDRDHYTRVFGIDQNRLRAGGEAMLAADGAVGAILLETGAGVRDLIGIQQDLDTRATKIYTHRRSGERVVYQALDALKAAREDLKRRQLLADDWTQAIAKLNAAEHARSELQERLRALAPRRSGLSRVRMTKPILAEIDVLLAELGDLVATPDLPKDFERRHADLEIEEAKGAAVVGSARSRLAE